MIARPYAQAQDAVQIAKRIVVDIGPAIGDGEYCTIVIDHLKGTGVDDALDPRRIACDRPERRLYSGIVCAGPTRCIRQQQKRLAGLRRSERPGVSDQPVFQRVLPVTVVFVEDVGAVDQGGRSTAKRSIERADIGVHGSDITWRPRV